MADTKKLAKALGNLLADSYVLYLKTQNYHWNVTGSNFAALHLLFEQQYTDLQAAVDVIAERIRALGHYAPGSFGIYSKMTNITEAGDKVPNANGMLKNLAKDQQAILKTAQKALDEAKKADDEVTVSLISDRMTIHEKNAWMLESSAK